MLCIGLAPGEKVGIGQNIVVTNCGDARIRIGIEAPRDVAVLRENAKRKRPKVGKVEND